MVDPDARFEAGGEGETTLESRDLPPHGGDIAAAAARYGIAPADWLDLSTGINPQAYPVPPLGPASWRNLPDAGATGALIAAARVCYGISGAAGVTAAPGTQALIQWLPRVLGTGTVAVLSPTYGEHETAWRAAGAAVSCVADLEGGDAADVFVVVNPNNPDGRCFEPLDLLRRAEDCARRGAWLVVDEAFCDVLPEMSLARHAGAPGLVILRSFGKFFGLAGARLGFALAPVSLTVELDRALGPWAVSGPAAAVGAAALRDLAWIAETRGRLAADARRLDALLTRAGLEVAGGTDLFRLTHFEEAWAVYHALAGRGILCRAFPAHPEWLRFGLPGSDAEFDRLERALHPAVAEAREASLTL